MILERLIQNAAYIPEFDLYIKSTHVHDYINVQLNDGREYAIDGGLEYARRVGDFTELELVSRVIDMTLYTTDSINKIAENILWKTFGKNREIIGGKWVLLSKCETAHLESILSTQAHIKNSIIEKSVIYLLNERKQVEA